MPTLMIENMPLQLHVEIQKAAKYNCRSMTQQALTFLEQVLNEKIAPIKPKSQPVEIEGFKERLKALREKALLSQSEMAEKANISQLRLEKLETGELYPFKAVAEVAKLAQALNVTSLWLVYGDLPTTTDSQRIALVDSIQGKYAFVKTSSEEFAERKLREYELDDCS